MADETTGEAEGIAREGASKPVQTSDKGALSSSAPLSLATPAAAVPATPLPPPAQAPASATLPGAGEEPLKADIAKILKEIKLPERRSLPGKEQKPPTKIPISTVLGDSMPKTEEAPAAQAPAPVRPQNPTGVNAVHTLKQDLQGVVQDQKISYVRAAALEQEKRRSNEIDPPITPVKRAGQGRGFGLLFAALLLIALGAAALGGVYYVATNTAAVPTETPFESLVFAEQTVSFPIDGSQPVALKAQLAQARLSSNASLGSITRIVPVVGASETSAGEAVSLEAFLAAIGARPPADLMRALGSDFFFGIHTVDENAPVIVIPVLSYDRAFAGMLEWEQTINDDLAPAFTPLPRLTTDASGIPSERVFTDIVRNNYDVRALSDDSGTIQLYYSFPTRGMLIIAESPYSFTEILNRLQAGRKL